MEWVLYALLATQIVLILLAGRGHYFLTEIMYEGIHRGDLDRATSVLQRQIGALVEELRKIEDRIANDGQKRNELLRKLLDSR